MVDDGGVGPPFGLGPLARVVDDKWIKQRHVFKSDLRVALVGQPDSLAGQPFHGAVFTDVNHSIGLENVSDPAIIGDIVMGGR